MEMVAITQDSPKFYSPQTLSQVTGLLSASSLSQVHLKEPHSPRPNCQGEAKQGRKEKQGTERRKGSVWSYHPVSPVSFLPGPFWPETPLQSMVGVGLMGVGVPLFCAPLLHSVEGRGI